MKALIPSFIIERCFVILTSCLLLITSSSAQDFHLSQYDAAPLYLNPAMTGMFSGHYRLHAHYRTQWKSVATKPFITPALSFDMPLKKFAWGVQVMNNRAGTGNYNVFNALASVAYDLTFDERNSHHLSIGLQGGIIQKSVDVNKLTFDNQYTYENGGTFDNTLPTGENFGSQSVIMPDAIAGLIYYYARESSRINPFIGFAAQHLTQPKESFFGAENKLPIRYVLHGGVKVNLSEKIQLLPKFFKMDQVNDNELTLSLLVHYYLKDADAFLIFGPTLRNYVIKDVEEDKFNNDAVIFELGLKYTKYTVRVSYDINTSTLRPSTRGKGGFEVSFTFIPNKLKANPVPNCPRI